MCHESEEGYETLRACGVHGGSSKQIESWVSLGAVEGNRAQRTEEEAGDNEVGPFAIDFPPPCPLVNRPESRNIDSKTNS